MKEYEFTVVLQAEEDGRFTALCPELQGCYTQGDTEAEALAMIKDAIRLHLEDRIANNETVPRKVEISTVRIAV